MDDKPCSTSDRLGEIKARKEWLQSGRLNGADALWLIAEVERLRLSNKKRRVERVEIWDKLVKALGYKATDAHQLFDMLDSLIQDCHQLRREIKTLAQALGTDAEHTVQGIVAQAVRSIKGQAKELAEIHDLLAEALGYHKDAEDDPNSPCPGEYVTGEHTSATLAMEAARKLKNSCLAEGNLGRSVDRAIDHVEELEHELAARKRQCSCAYWSEVDQLMPSPNCLIHGVEAHNKKMQGELAMNELRVLRQILLGKEGTSHEI